MGICECGCGNKTSGEKNRFVTGHNNRGKRKPPVSYVCRHCGVVNQVIPSEGGRIFCGSKCRDDFRKIQTGKLNPSYKRVEMDCDICGKPFAVIPSRLVKNQVYCSMACGYEGRRRKISGVRRNIENPSGKAAAKRRDEFRCLICNFEHVVAAHHIVPVKQGGTNLIGNIITLCPNHHYMAHAGMFSIDELTALVKKQAISKDILAPVPRQKARNLVNFRA